MFRGERYLPNGLFRLALIGLLIQGCTHGEDTEPGGLLGFDGFVGGPGGEGVSPVEPGQDIVMPGDGLEGDIQDANSDVQPDPVSDTAIGPLEDTSPNPIVDAGKDVGSDVVPDPFVDTTPDPAPDVVPDPFVDTTPDPAPDVAFDPANCSEVAAPEPIGTEILPNASPNATHILSTVDGFQDDYLLGPADYIQVAIRREWGGSIVFFGLNNGVQGQGPSNVIDAHDPGREVQVAFYDHERIQQGCAYNASCLSNPNICPNSITFLGWNPVQGGNECGSGSGVQMVDGSDGVLTSITQPLHWNPDWEASDCTTNGCANPAMSALQSQVIYTQRLRFVTDHIVEIEMNLENPTGMSHGVTNQEFPTLYATYGKDNTANLRRLFSSSEEEIIIDQPANDGFFVKPFVSPDGWAQMQNDALTYGVGMLWESRRTDFQGWQKAEVFNNFRAAYPFAIPANSVIHGRAYLLLGNKETVASQANWLDGALPPFGSVDTPAPEAIVSGTQMNLSGWVLDNKGISSLEMRVDGQSMGNLSVSVNRPDVCEMWPGYSMCDGVGFDQMIEITTLTPCAHLLEIVATDTDGNERIIDHLRFYKE